MALEEGVFEIGDLGAFSMKQIYEALSSKYGTCSRSHQESRQENDGFASDGSDSSWTTIEDESYFYINIRHILDDFILSPHQTTMTTELLSRRQRRFVHATAQVMRLGHASLGASGQHRRMLIFKSENLSFIPAEQPELTSLRSEHENTNSLPRKRKRLQRQDNGFPCRYTPCPRTFDRASERTKHEQAHQPALTSRYKCPHCPSGFRYPKDLRRHARTHAEADASGEMLSSSFGSTQISYGSVPALSAESRMPSDVSLTFRSREESRAVSPALVPWDGDPSILGTGAEVEPLMLLPGGVLGDFGIADELGGWKDGFPLGYDAFAGFGFDEGEGTEEEFLEMARVRKT